MPRWSLLTHACRTSVRLAALSTLLFGTTPAEAQRAPTTPPGDVFSSPTNCQVVFQRTSEQINAQHSQDWPACGGASACIRAANAKKADALKKANQDLRLCQASSGATPPPTTSQTPPAGPRPLDTIVTTPPPRDRQPVEISPPNTDVGPLPSPSRPRQRPVGPIVTPDVTPPTRPQDGGAGTGNGPGKGTPPPPPSATSTQREVPPWDNSTGGGRPRTWKNVPYKQYVWSIYTDETGQPWAFRPDFDLKRDDGELINHYKLDPATVQNTRDPNVKSARYRAVDTNGVRVPGVEPTGLNGYKLYR